MFSGGFTILGVRPRVILAALLGGAFLFLGQWGGPPTALAASPITGVAVSPDNANLHSGQAFYLRATVQGTGDFDHRVNWSLSPANAGTVSPTGLFISHPAFTGAALVKATSVEAPTYSDTATINVSTGAGTLHVDHNNAGSEDGSTLHPYRTVQGAVNNAVDGDTIKVAQGTYTENVALDWRFGVLLLGGFKGGSAADYTGGLPGDFVTRSTDHVTQVTTIQSPSRTNPVVDLGTYNPPTPLTYAVDGFTLTGGFNGVSATGGGPVSLFISQNLIDNNGPEVPVTYDTGAGIQATGINTLVLDNRIANNRTNTGGGFYIDTAANSFLIQGNLIENNNAVGCGGGYLGQGNQDQGTGLFTWNIVRDNTSGDMVTYGEVAGVGVGGGPVELSHNIYAYNIAKDVTGGIQIRDETSAVLRHELIYGNNVNSWYGGAGVYVSSPNSQVTVEHCTISYNANLYEGATGGLYVTQTANAQVRNSIIWGNSGNQVYVFTGGVLTMTYSNSQIYAGAGNISRDPFFANPATDDYHLQSIEGRWDPATSQWVVDKLHSYCIDAGNPAAAFDQEPIPNGSRTNMGVYGNTPEASKSHRFPVSEGLLYLLLGGS